MATTIKNIVLVESREVKGIMVLVENLGDGSFRNHTLPGKKKENLTRRMIDDGESLSIFHLVKTTLTSIHFIWHTILCRYLMAGIKFKRSNLVVRH